MSRPSDGFPRFNRVLARAERMDAMLAATGGNALMAIRRDGGDAWLAARARCIDCGHEWACCAWLAGVRGTGTADAPAFCPNAPFLAACRAEA